MPTNLFRRDAQKLMQEGAQVVEVLEARQYREAHLPGAIHIPLRDLAQEAPAGLQRDRPVIVYCYDFA
jgi:rhodanese-related sulfurtransferase